MNLSVELLALLKLAKLKHKKKYKTFFKYDPCHLEINAWSPGL